MTYAYFHKITLEGREKKNKIQHKKHINKDLKSQTGVFFGVGGFGVIPTKTPAGGNFGSFFGLFPFT